MQHEFAELDRETEKSVKEIGIPPCPAVLATLVREMRDDDPDLVRVAKLITSDVSLSAAMLKTVNSPFYGLRTKATSVQQALTIIGLATAAQVVTCLLLRQAFASCDSSLMERFWDKSSKIAGLAAHIAVRTRIARRDEAYTFGLFRDAGMPLMMQTVKNYSKALNLAVASPGGDMTEIEQGLFKMDHAQVGYLLATSWYLPDAVCRAIRFHHDYARLDDSENDLSPQSVRLVALGFAAEHLLTVHWDSSVATWRSQPCSDRVLARLDMSEVDFDELSQEVADVVAQH